ncbi:MAG: hypothetical protein ACTSVW_00490, partial [Candidatus Njordarchaeales archaeon]
KVSMMPKPGYTTITLKTQVAQLLKQKAQHAGLGLNQYLLALLNRDRPRTVPHGVENKRELGLFQRKSWARRYAIKKLSES